MAKRCASAGAARETATCLNLARGGRSSGSYRAEGLWDAVLDTLRDGSAGPTLVLIQFGHNDQPGKPGRSTDLAVEFPANLQRYVQETRALGAWPVLVTPLVRRQFDTQGQLRNDLEPGPRPCARWPALSAPRSSTSTASVRPRSKPSAPRRPMNWPRHLPASPALIARTSVRKGPACSQGSVEQELRRVVPQTIDASARARGRVPSKVSN